MVQEPKKIQLDGSTYVTKVNGKLVMVRERPDSALDICMDLLGEVFRRPSHTKMTEQSNKPDVQNAACQNPVNGASQNSATSPQQRTPFNFHPNASMIGPPISHAIIGPMGPQPGIYQRGNRQLALLPINPQGASIMAQKPGFPYSAQWMYPTGSYMGGFNFPPIGNNPMQFMGPPMNVMADGGTATQTSVTVTKHICAHCGKLRSRKYQHENPLKQGEVPVPAFCRKCQKYETSTERSQSSDRSSKKLKHKSKKNNMKKSDGYGGPSKDSIDSGQLPKSPITKKKGKESELEDDVSMEERGRSSRPRLPIDTHPHGNASGNQRPPSPLLQQPPSRHSRSTDWAQGNRVTPARQPFRADCQAQRSPVESIATDEAEDFYCSRKRAPRSRFEKYETLRDSRAARGNEEAFETMLYREDSFDEQEIESTIRRTRDASRRRRLERSTGEEGFYRRATRPLHDIRPSRDDEVVVVTERWVYGPKRSSHVREEGVQDSRQERIDKATFGVEKLYQQFASEPAASDNYQGDCSREKPREREPHRRTRARDIRGDFAPPSSCDSDDSSEICTDTRENMRYPSRAPSPLKPLQTGADTDSWTGLPRHEVPYLLSEDEEITPRRVEPFRDHDRRGRSRARRTSAYKPPYVREATDGGTEKALMPSPRHSREPRFYSENTSEDTEELERVERHVTFRELEVAGHDQSRWASREKQMR